MYPEKFDRTRLTVDDYSILEAFAARRSIFDSFIKKNKLKIFTCPGCGFPALESRGGYDICAICNWEDDNQDNEKADEIWGGPNANLSLTENRLIIGRRLKELEISLNGEINNDTYELLIILANHEKRMKRMSDKISSTTDITDPLWDEWRKESAKVIIDLIKRK